MHDMDVATKVVKRFYAKLYTSNIRSGDTIEPTSLAWEVHLITKKEVGKALENMRRGKIAGDDGKARIT